MTDCILDNGVEWYNELVHQNSCEILNDNIPVLNQFYVVLMTVRYIHY